MMSKSAIKKSPSFISPPQNKNLLKTPTLPKPKPILPFTGTASFIQPKLRIGKPNDKYEKEADRVADQVMRMPQPQGLGVSGQGALVQRESTCPECKDEEDEKEKNQVQTKPISEQITPLVQRDELTDNEDKEIPGEEAVQEEDKKEDEEDEGDIAQPKLMDSGIVQRLEDEPEEDIKEDEEDEGDIAQPKLMDNGTVQRLEDEPEDEEGKEEKIPEEEDEDVPIRAKPVSNKTPTVTPGVQSQIQSMKGGGQPLYTSVRNYFEPRFGRDFSNVRVHTGAKAADASKSINAKAFTTGKDVVFGSGQYSPNTSTGRRLLSHELTHVVQQKSHFFFPLTRLQRQKVEIRSPVIEETLTQYSALIKGRYLTPNEIKLAKSVFGNSIDYSRVRFIKSEGKAVDWRVVGNTIREPKGFTIKDAYMAKTFIHEMTHIWQYQHGGTSYISGSLVDNIAAAIRYGLKKRSMAYKYKILPGKTFFEYRVEQQGAIVERYFEILQKLKKPRIAPGDKSELKKELDQLLPLIKQMRASIPRSEADILKQRAQEVMTTKPQFLQDITPKERQLLPIKPILEINF